MINMILITHDIAIIPGAVVRLMNIGVSAFEKIRGENGIEKEKIP